MTMEVPARIEDISQDWLVRVLHECGFLGGAKIRSFVNEPFDPGAGQLSAITRLRFEHEEPTNLVTSLVMKFRAPTPSAHDVCMRYRAYE